MTQLEKLDFSPFVNKAVSDVFSTMLSLSAEPLQSDASGPLADNEKYMGQVGLAGKVAGAVCLTFSKELATFLAGSMLGLEPEEIGSDEVRDVIGELCNMVGGNIKSRLCDMGYTCALTIPSITSGKDFNFQPLKDPIHRSYTFKTNDFLWLLELYLKENLT